MKYSSKIYDYEIRGQDLENELINEKINYTARNYFYLVNNFSKQISKMENEINFYQPNNPIKINELIYNQHIIIKELISIINKKSKINTQILSKNDANSKIICDLPDDNEVINIASFSIISQRKSLRNNTNIFDPSQVYKKKITTNNNKCNINTSKSELSKSFDKNILNTISTYDYSLNSQNKYNYINFTPMTEKIKKENNYYKYYNLKSSFNNLKYKYYKPSFLNSFVSGNKSKNRISKFKNNSVDLISSNRNTCEKKRNKYRNRNGKSVSNFNVCNSFESNKKVIKRVKSCLCKNNKMNNTMCNLKISDDFIVNNLVNRPNSKPNKYVKNLYLISNEIVDRYRKKMLDN